MNKLSHVAFIMDGNGRWVKKRNKGRNFGHLKGVEVVKKIVKYSILQSKNAIFPIFRRKML
jgi:undecaprenyl diphosphate synthase